MIESAMQVRQLGLVEYLPTFEAMKAFTAARNTQNTPSIGIQPNEYERNQLLICEHPAVYTQGLAGTVEHVLNPGGIPVVQTDRGGQANRKTIEMCKAIALLNEP